MARIIDEVLHLKDRKCVALAIALLALAPHVPRGVRVERPPMTGQVFLSGFEERSGSCAWELIDPLDGSEQEIAVFPEHCDGVNVSWSPSAREALVTFPGSKAPVVHDVEGNDQTTVGTIWLVDFGARRAGRLRSPLGETRVVGFDQEGMPNAVVFQAGRSWSHVGDTVRAWLGLSLQGTVTTPSRFELHTFAGRWREREVAEQISWLDSLDPRRTSIVLRTYPLDDSLSAGFAAIAEEVADTPCPRFALPPSGRTMPGSCEWRGLPAVGPGIAIRTTRIGSHPSDLAGPLVFFGSSGPIVGETRREPDRPLRVEARGAFVLSETRVSGSTPRVFDVRTGAVLFDSDRHQGVTFWPDEWLVPPARP